MAPPASSGTYEPEPDECGAGSGSASTMRWLVGPAEPNVKRPTAPVADVTGVPAGEPARPVLRPADWLVLPAVDEFSAAPFVDEPGAVGLATGWLTGADVPPRLLALLDVALLDLALLAGELFCARTDAGEKFGDPPPNVQACTAPPGGLVLAAPVGLSVQLDCPGLAFQYDQEALAGGVVKHF